MGKRKRTGTARPETSAQSEYLDPTAAKFTFNSYRDVPDSEDEFFMGREQVPLAHDTPATNRQRLPDRVEGMLTF